MEKILTIQAAVKPDDATKAVSILAYNGAVMVVGGWGPVVIDLAGLQIPQQVPLLADHQNTIDAVAGHGVAKIIEGSLRIDGRLIVKSEAGQKLIELARGGLELQASVGVQPEEYHVVQAGKQILCNNKTIEHDEPFTFIKKGRLQEVSVVVLGADSQTSVAVAAKKIFSNSNGVSMKPEITTLRAAAAEYTDLLPAAKIDETILASAEAGESIDDFRKRLLAAVKLEKMLAARPTSPRVGFNGGDGNASGHDVLKATWLLKMGREGIAEKQFATNKAVLDAAMKNRRVHAMELLGVRENSDSAIRASFSTNETATVFTDALKMVAFERWNGLPQGWPLIAKKRSVPNFHEHNTPRPYLKNGQLETVPPTGEIKHATLGDENYSVRAATKARMFGITRTDIINDQLGGLAEYVESLVYESYRTLQDDLFNAILNAGTFFSTDNGNYASGATTALSIDSLGAALRMMRMQTDPAGRPIDARPHALVGGPNLEADARQILASVELARTGDNSPIANPWKDLNLKLVVEPRIAVSGGSWNPAWYLVGDPALVPALTASFLNGNERPTVEQNAAPFEVLGEQWRCYFDYGIDLADHRAIVKMAGA